MEINVNLGGGRLGSPLHIAVSKLDVDTISEILNKVEKIKNKKNFL